MNKGNTDKAEVILGEQLRRLVEEEKQDANHIPMPDLAPFLPLMANKEQTENFVVSVSVILRLALHARLN